MANKKADLLIQRADHKQDKDDNDEIVVLKLEHFHIMIMLMIEEMQTKVKHATCNHHSWDKNILGSLNHNRGMEMREGLLYYNKRIYIPQDHAL